MINQAERISAAAEEVAALSGEMVKSIEDASGDHRADRSCSAGIIGFDGGIEFPGRGSRGLVSCTGRHGQNAERSGIQVQAGSRRGHSGTRLRNAGYRRNCSIEIRPADLAVLRGPGDAIPRIPRGCRRYRSTRVLGSPVGYPTPSPAANRTCVSRMTQVRIPRRCG